MKEDIVVLFSGGSDSVLLMEICKSIGKKPLAVMINYSQINIGELNKAKEYCEKNEIKYKLIELKNYDVRSGLTTGEKGIYENVNEYNVPARNTIFLSIAAGIAESENINNIFIGCDMTDFYGKFPDCYQSYIGKIKELFKIAFSHPINVEAPLLGFSKENVNLMLKFYGIKEEDVFSGYGEL